MGQSAIERLIVAASLLSRRRWLVSSFQRAKGTLSVTLVAISILAMVVSAEAAPSDAIHGEDNREEASLLFEGRPLDVRGYAAWLLATHDDPRIRNGAVAVKIAESILQELQGANVRYLDVAAAAYAEVGRFGAAIRCAQRALSAAAVGGLEAEEIGRRLELYREGVPFREPQAPLDPNNGALPDARRIAAHVHLLVAHDLARQSRDTESLRELTEAVQSDPNYRAAHLALADAQFARGHDDEAKQHYRVALSFASNDPQTLVKLAAVHKRQQETVEQLAALHAALQRKPDLWEAANSMAWTLATHSDGAIRDAERAVRLAEDAVSGTERSLASYLDTLGAAYAELGRFEEAAAAVCEAIALTAAAEGTEPREAILRDYEDRLELYQFEKPYRGRWQMHHDLGKLLWKAGRDEEAIRHRMAALGKEDSPEVIARLATELRQEGYSSDAARMYRVVWRQRPDWLAVGNSLAWMLSTSADAKDRDGDEAIGLARRICHSTRFLDPRYLDTLAAAYAELGRFQEAIAAQQEALRLVADGSLQAGENQRRQRYLERLQSYRQKVPWRESASRRLPNEPSNRALQPSITIR